MHAESMSVPQIIAQHRQILRGGNDEDLAQASEHQRSQWIANHRLVVDRQQLLADDLCDRIQPSSGATREQNGPFLHFGLRIADCGFFTGILREPSLRHPPDPYLRPEAFGWNESRKL